MMIQKMSSYTGRLVTKQINQGLVKGNLLGRQIVQQKRGFFSDFFVLGSFSVCHLAHGIVEESPGLAMLYITVGSIGMSYSCASYLEKKKIPDNNLGRSDNPPPSSGGIT